MQSSIKEAMGMKYEPVALIWSDEKPEGARQFKEGRWGCVMFLVAAAARGKTAVFDRKTFGCWGGGVGLGFGNRYKDFPGGEDCFCCFLSTGNQQREEGRRAAENIKHFMRDEAYENFVHGEGYVKTPELVRKFIECLPITDIPAKYVVLKPLSGLDPERETPKAVIFLADQDQVAALTVLANYDREGNENVIVPYAAGCQTIGIYPYREAASPKPRAVLGMTDLSARLAVKRQLKDDLMTFAVPWEMFASMESNVPGSFLQRTTWKELEKLKES